MHTQPAPPILLARVSVAAVLLFLFVQLSSAGAHPSLDEGIARLTLQLASQPVNAALFVQRAELYRQHEQFDAALADLAKAEQRQPGSTVVMLARAQVFSDVGQTTNALAAVQQFIAVATNNASAFVLRARCRLKLNEVGAAVADYNRALKITSTPEPDLWLERARAQAALGQFAGAVRGLDEGMARIGEVPTLQLAAIEYERQGAEFDAALARVDKLAAQHPGTESWLVLRGEILAQAGRLAEAREAFQQALTEIENYPPSRRGLEQTIQLQTHARAGLARAETRIVLQSKP
jgi:predicted Zn-dependent protease